MSNIQTSSTPTAAPTGSKANLSRIDVFGASADQLSPSELRNAITGYELRYRIEAVVAGITEKKLKHIYHGDGAATGREVMILPAIPQTKLFATEHANIILGYTMHETCHQLHTDFSLLETIFAGKGKPTKREHQLKSFWNAIEDYRIEKVGRIRYPGFHKFISATRHFSALRFVERFKAGEICPKAITNPYAIGAVALTWVGAKLNKYPTTMSEEALCCLSDDLRAWTESWGPEMALVTTNQEAFELANKILDDLDAQRQQQDDDDSATGDPGNSNQQNQQGQQGQQGDPSDGDPSDDSSDGSSDSDTDQPNGQDGTDQGKPDKSKKNSKDNPEQFDDAEEGDGAENSQDESQKDGEDGDEDNSSDGAGDENTGEQSDDQSGSQSGNDANEDDQSDSTNSNSSQNDAEEGSDQGSKSASDENQDDSQPSAGDNSDKDQPDSSAANDDKDDDQANTKGTGSSRPKVKVNDGDEDADAKESDLEIDEISEELSKKTTSADRIMPNIDDNVGRTEVTEVERGQKRYTQIRSQIGPAASRAAGVMRRMLMARDVTRVRRELDEGSLDLSRLVPVANGSMNIYKRTATRSDINTAVSIMVDNSGSMSGVPITVCQQASIVLDMAIQGTKADLEINGFTGSIYSPVIYRYRTFGQKGQASSASLGNMDQVSLGGTPVSQAMLDAWRRLHEHKAPRKIMIIVTDGDADDQERSREVHDIVVAMGGLCVGIGIGQVASLGRWCSNVVQVNAIEDLPIALSQIVQQAMTPSRRAA